MPPRRIQRGEIEHIRAGPIIKQAAAERVQRTKGYVEAVKHTRGRRLFPGRAHFVTAEEAARLLEHDDVLRADADRGG